MKKLTFSTMAAARLRANKRQYLSLVLGIFLSIFMVSTLVFSVWGIYQAQLQQRYDTVGYIDLVLLDNPILEETDVHEMGSFETCGHVCITGTVTDRNVYVGYYDDAAMPLMNMQPVEGRLPESAGEIAMERSAMDILEATWTIGEYLELEITPLDGTPEKRNYTLVGILPERSAHLAVSDHDGLSQFPAILTAPDDSVFATGRTGVHHVMKLSQVSSLSRELQTFFDRYMSSGLGGYYYGLSTTGQQIMAYSADSALYEDREMFALMLMAFVLAGSLILSCSIGISGAMEGVLMKRRDEIGVLRALGATRRQIRRMFGRENLLIALVVSPLSILGSLGVIWGLSRMTPERMEFSLNLWLIAPIAVFSVMVILISGYIPLVRASKLMPMSVIRDTAMLRRSKHIKSKDIFSPTRLIAARQIRFHPTRQIGAMLLVGLMLLCSGILSAAVYTYQDFAFEDAAGFYINKSYGYENKDGITLYDKMPISDQSISQIRTLDHVESIRMDREMDIIAQLDEVPRYALLFGHQEQYGMLDDEMFQEALSISSIHGDWMRNHREEMRKGYLQLLETYRFDGEAFRMSIMTVDLSAEHISELKEHLMEGAVNVDAINAGTQVLILAPEIWIYQNEQGSTQLFGVNSPAYEQYKDRGAVRIAWNDSFTVGQSIPLTQLYSENPDYSSVIRNDATVQVCGIVDSLGDLPFGSRGNCVIITTEAGLANMGLRVEGLDSIEVFTDENLTLEAEERLERQINAIVRRSEGYSVQNYMENARERAQAQRQELILYFSISLVFFAVSVGMIVSASTRQLHSEGRTIGMLRAVGADERAILGCYSGRIYASVLGGMGISFGIDILILLSFFLDSVINDYNMSRLDLQTILLMAVMSCIMGGLCLLVCKFLLRFRIREIVNKSIIDNIREL